MPSLLELKEAEKMIESVVSLFVIEGLGFEDKVEICRIAVWNAIEQKNISAEDYGKEKYRNLLWSVASRALSDAASAKRPKIRTWGKDEKQARPDDLHKALLLQAAKRHRVKLQASDKHGDAVLLRKLSRESHRLRTAESKCLVVWQLVELMGIEVAAVPKRINYQTFVEHGLGAWLWVFFNNSPYRAINCAYPGRFLPYHMAHAPMRYWMDPEGQERAVAALASALESTGLEPELYPKALTERFFEEFKLTTPLQKLFKTHYGYLNAAYPGKYHPWELPCTTPNFFEKKENVVKAVRWMVEEKLKYPIPDLTIPEIWRQQIAIKITKETFSQYGLREIMANYKSPEPVLRMVYPDKFLPWSFQNKTKWQGEAGKKLAAQATRWFVEEYLKLRPTSRELTWDMFRKNGLNGMISSRSLGFNSSPRAALRNAYPELVHNFD